MGQGGILGFFGKIVGVDTQIKDTKQAYSDVTHAVSDSAKAASEIANTTKDVYKYFAWGGLVLVGMFGLVYIMNYSLTS